MQTTIVFEDQCCRDLLPLVYWRPVFDLRVGLCTLLENIQDNCAHAKVSLFCRPTLADVVADRHQLEVNQLQPDENTLFVNARLILSETVKLQPAPCVQWHGNEPILIHADRELAARLTPDVMLSSSALRQIMTETPQQQMIESPQLIRYPWDLTNHCSRWIKDQAERSAALGEHAGRCASTAVLVNAASIAIGAGSAIDHHVVLDASEGPIVIGQDVTISPHATIIGPCFIGDGTIVRPQAVIREGTSIGPKCKVGGEIEDAIIHGYSNKQHDGFLGHAYIGEWVNLGAGTTNSDLKNTYGTVRVSLGSETIDTGSQFVGLFMGDFSKAGIGQLFATGSVVGIGSNVATGGSFPPKFIPSFSWITADGQQAYDAQRCLEVAQRMMQRRDRAMTPAEKRLFLELPEIAAQHESSPGKRS